MISWQGIQEIAITFPSLILNGFERFTGRDNLCVGDSAGFGGADQHVAFLGAHHFLPVPRVLRSVISERSAPF